MKPKTLALAMLLLVGVVETADAGLVDPTASPIVAVSHEDQNIVLMLDTQGHVWEYLANSNVFREQPAPLPPCPFRSQS